MNLSVGLVTFNEEVNLARTLDAVCGIADEIVIVDSGSTDGTPQIAASYGARFFVEKWAGIGRQKNSVIDKCRGKWILLIDADEEISPALRDEIRQITTSGETPFQVYDLRFLTICFGQVVRHGGWSGFYRPRLFRNGAGRCNENQVHEKFVTKEKICRIDKDIYHHTYHSYENFIRKFNEYTSESADMYFKQGKGKSSAAAVLSACYSFLKSYVFKLGFLDGYTGYLLAKFGAITVLMKYAKLKLLQKRGVEVK